MMHSIAEIAVVAVVVMTGIDVVIVVVPGGWFVDGYLPPPVARTPESQSRFSIEKGGTHIDRSTAVKRSGGL